jgi:hypothetical protein
MLAFSARSPLAVTLLAGVGLACGWAPASLAQTPAGKAPTAGEAAQDPQAKSEDDLYILKDIPEPAPVAPKLDLGKVGEKGKLSLERMPGAGEGEDAGKPKGAAGILLKIPLGKPGE